MPPKKLIIAGNPIISGDLNGFVCEKILTHFEAASDLWTIAATGVGSASIDTTNHELDLSTGTGAAATASLIVKPLYRVPSTSRQILRLRFVVSVITAGTGATATSQFGFYRNAGGLENYVQFYVDGTGAWSCKTKYNYQDPATQSVTSSTNISTPAAGSVLTIDITHNGSIPTANFYVGSTEVASITSGIPSKFVDLQVRFYVDSSNNSVARVMSIDRFTLIRYP